MRPANSAFSHWALAAWSLAAAVGLATLWSSDTAVAAHPGANGLIAYVKKGPACPAPECGDALWVSALDGSSARRLVVSQGRTRTIFYPTWSPDGKTIAYLDYTDGGIPGNRLKPPRWYQVWVINADGSGRRVILTSKKLDRRTHFARARPSWTSNGRELTYQTANALWAINIRTKKLRRIMALPQMAGNAQFSPDGRHIAYTNAAGELFITSATGRGATRVARIDPYGFNDNFDWSPDSQKLAVLVDLGTPAIVSVTGGIGPPLVEGGWDRPIWSPDGSTILSQRDQVSEPDPTRPGYERSRTAWDRFTTINPDGSGFNVVGPGAGSCKTPGGDRRPCEVRDPSWQPRR